AFVARQGEKKRVVDVVLEQQATKGASAPPTSEPPAGQVPPAVHTSEPSAPSPAPLSPAMDTRPTAGTVYALGGVGVAALGVFSGFAISGLSARGDLDEKNCRPNCPEADLDVVRGRFLVADISLGVSVVALGAATLVYLMRP